MEIVQQGDYILVEDDEDRFGCDICCFSNGTYCVQPEGFDCFSYPNSYCHWEERKDE